MKYLATIWWMIPKWWSEFRESVKEYERQHNPRTMDLDRLRSIAETKRWLPPQGAWNGRPWL